MVVTDLDSEAHIKRVLCLVWPLLLAGFGNVVLGFRFVRVRPLPMSSALAWP